MKSTCMRRLPCHPPLADAVAAAAAVAVAVAVAAAVVVVGILIYVASLRTVHGIDGGLELFLA